MPIKIDVLKSICSKLYSGIRRYSLVNLNIEILFLSAAILILKAYISYSYSSQYSSYYESLLKSLPENKFFS